MKSNYYILTLILLIVCSHIFAQDKENYYLADEFINRENFGQAVKMYHKILEKNPKNSELHFKLGFCYLNKALQKHKSIKHLEKAIKYRSKDGDKENDAPIEAYFYLGRAYRINYQVDKARNTLNELKERIPGRMKKFHKKIEEELQKCNTLTTVMKDSVSLEVTNLGGKINSPFTDHSPVISGDESVLIFTSRRKSREDEEKAFDGEYYEDIFISSRRDSLWSSPKPISKNINTKGHEASIGLSADGRKLYIYKADNSEGSIYVSNLKGNEWSTPRKMPEPINSDYRETHASISSDGERLFFTSNRDGGHGGLDIYEVRKLPNGEWGKPMNLGKNVNTEKDEEGPYLQLDNKTLYFASEGHNSIGGFDIFKTTYNEETDTWSKAENLGYPVNTTSNEIYFMPTPDGKRAYFVSQREEGHGKADLYLMKLPEKKSTKVTVVTGYMWICKGELPPIKITVYDAESGEIYGIYRANQETGKYLYVLNRGKKYNIEYEADNRIIHEEKFYISDTAKYRKINRTIQIPSGHPCDGNEALIPDSLKIDDENEEIPIIHGGVVYDKEIKIDNILFPFGKANKIPSNKNLNDLAEYLKNNPGAVIEVGGHADSKGPAAYNKKLTKKRAEMAKQYLVNKGVNPEQIETKGYGEARPITRNKNPDGSYNPKGQKYNRRVEFKVIEQGEEKLYVNPVADIPEDLKIEDNTESEDKEDPENPEEQDK